MSEDFSCQVEAGRARQERVLRIDNGLFYVAAGAECVNVVGNFAVERVFPELKKRNQNPIAPKVEFISSSFIYLSSHLMG